MDWLKNKFSQLRIKLHDSVHEIARKRVATNKKSVRSTVAGIEVGNFFIAVSTTGLMALGAIPMSLSILIVLAIIFLVIGIIGRYVDAVEDDVERLLKYEELVLKDTSGVSVNSASSSSIQQQDH